MVQSVLSQLLVVFFITIFVIAVCRRIKFPPIIGYIVVGVIISIIGKTSFKHFEDLNVLARYGVVFLLFSIGLEFSLPHLMSMRKTVFGAGSMQMLICGGGAYLICLALKLSHPTAFVIAMSVAMSSTAITSKILTETGELNTNVGKLSMSMLIFQDLMVVPAIIITEFFAQPAGTDIFNALVFDLIKGVFTFTVLVIVGKKIFTPIFEEVARARSGELSTLTTLFIVLGAAYFSELMGMSNEFGAFLAGAIIGGTPYHHQVESEIRPFRDVLLGLFFIGIGTMLDITVLTGHFALIIAIACAILIGKLLTISLLTKWLKLATNKESTKIGLYLAQGGEFGFVLFALASGFNLFANTLAQVLLASLIVSMLLSMILIRFAPYYLPTLNFILFRERKAQPDDLADIKVKGKIIIIGFSRFGQWISRALTTEGHDYLALDVDPTLVNQTRLAGENVVYADALDANVLRTLRIDEASAVVLTFQDPVVSLKVLGQLRLMSKTLPILVRTKDDIDIERLMDAGATQVIADALEASLMLSLHLLVTLGMDLKAAIEWSENIRKDRHGLLKGYFLGEEDKAFADNAMTQAVLQRPIMIEAGYAADGKTLHALHPVGYGVEILALRKNGILAPYPAPQARVYAGDVLIAQGLPDNLERFKWYLMEGT